MTVKLVQLSEIPAPVKLVKSARAKRLSITIKPHHGIRVTVPTRCSYKAAQEFLSTCVPWIKKSLKRIRQIENDNPVAAKIDKKAAKESLISRLNYLAQKNGFKFNRVFIRSQKTRWGSCSEKNNINLNVNLVRLPQELIDYVILHELVHIKIKNHGKEFWASLEKYIQGSKLLDKKLKKYWL